MVAAKQAIAEGGTKGNAVGLSDGAYGLVVKMVDTAS